MTPRPPTAAQAARFQEAVDRLDRIHERFAAVGIELTSGGLELTVEEAEEVLLRLEDGRTIRRFGWRRAADAPVEAKSDTPLLDELRAWLDEEVRPPTTQDPQGVRRSQTRPRARVRGSVGGLGYTGARVDVQVRRAGTRNRYSSVHERTLADGQLELAGPTGRYVDWREVVRNG